MTDNKAAASSATVSAVEAQWITEISLKFKCPYCKQVSYLYRRDIRRDLNLKDSDENIQNDNFDREFECSDCPNTFLITKLNAN